MKDDLVNKSGDLVNDLVNDTISRAAAIDALDKVAEMFPYRIPGKAKTYRQYNEAWSDAIDAAENALEALPSAQPGWIPVTERLPENGYWLWSAKGGEVQKDFYWNGHWENAEKYGYEVIAWMPLPTPYREGEQDGEG